MATNVKYIVDASVLLAVGRGDWLKIEMLGLHRKRDVAVPEPVVLRSAREVRALTKPSALRRWEMLMAEMPRVPWTKEVTDKLLELGVPGDLDAVTAAHALAHDATVLTTDRARYTAIPGLRIDEL